MSQYHDLNRGFAAYRAYYRQDPSQRRLSDFIDILDSIYLPASSASRQLDLALYQLYVADNERLRQISMSAEGKTRVQLEHLIAEREGIMMVMFDV